MSEFENWPLLARYLSDECSEEEMKEIKAWINSNGENKEWVKMMQLVWKTNEPNPPKSNVKVLWQKVAREAGIMTDSKIQEDAVTQPTFIRKIGWPKWRPADGYGLLRYAAILFVAIALGYIFNRVFPIWSNDSGLITRTVENAGREKIVLGDGTKLVLDAGSSFNYPKQFEGETRDVYLIGEGYFEVAPEPDKPFIVHANHAAIKVLGTRFNVRAWQSEEKVTVAVAEGKVVLQPDRAASPDSVLLTEQQISTLRINERPSAPKVADIDKYMGWMQNIIFFEDAPLSTILTQLERWYDVQFVYDDPTLTQEHLNVYIKGESIGDVLNLLTTLTDLQFKQTGKSVYVMKYSESVPETI